VCLLACGMRRGIDEDVFAVVQCHEDLPLGVADAGEIAESGEQGGLVLEKVGMRSEVGTNFISRRNSAWIPANEVDDGAARTDEVIKLLNGGGGHLREFLLRDCFLSLCTIEVKSESGAEPGERRAGLLEIVGDGGEKDLVSGGKGSGHGQEPNFEVWRNRSGTSSMVLSALPVEQFTKRSRPGHC
jgi:hypothetical protein